MARRNIEYILLMTSWLSSILGCCYLPGSHHLVKNWISGHICIWTHAFSDEEQNKSTRNSTEEIPTTFANYIEINKN